MIEQIRKGITKNKIANYYNVNGLVVNPQDWETIELAKGSDAHYVWTTVGTGVNAQIWRVPVIESNAMTVGDFLLGDWTMGATLYDREQMNVRVSESHADLFVRNGVAILAEERIALGLERPKAFTKGKFTVASA
jgi:HK97 family phage major capsid protein